MNDTDPRFQAARLVLQLRQAGVTDHNVTEALETTPRDQFTPRPFEADAWENVELPIDCGQSMTRPVTVGVMVQALGAQKEHTVLEIGCGTGYVAAVLSRLARRVYSMDRYRTLVDKARVLLERLHLAAQIEVRHGDGLAGWPEAAPFDRILLMGAVTELPPELARQLAPGGVVVMPVERAGRVVVVRLVKQPDGAFAETVVAPASFAPLEPGIAREL
jgi:protein-L-isoaspartate(D-aspartate) O-methyltransferase